MKEALSLKIVQKQFDMIGAKIKFSDIPDDGYVIVKKKKVKWYDHYKFADEAQYLEWREWALKEVNGDVKSLNELDLIYGLHYGYKKEGELF